MAVEDQIVTILKTDPAVSEIVEDRVFAMPAPQGTPSPFITYMMVGVSRVGRDFTGQYTHDRMAMQIDCWADQTMNSSAQSRYSKIVRLSRAVRSALDRRGDVGEDTIDYISWDAWTDDNTPEHTRRIMDFTLAVRDP